MSGACSKCARRGLFTRVVAPPLPRGESGGNSGRGMAAPVSGPRASPSPPPLCRCAAARCAPPRASRRDRAPADTGWPLPGLPADRGAGGVANTSSPRSAAATSEPLRPWRMRRRGLPLPDPDAGPDARPLSNSDGALPNLTAPSSVLGAGMVEPPPRLRDRDRAATARVAPPLAACQVPWKERAARRPRCMRDPPPTVCLRRSGLITRSSSWLTHAPLLPMPMLCARPRSAPGLARKPRPAATPTLVMEPRPATAMWLMRRDMLDPRRDGRRSGDCMSCCVCGRGGGCIDTSAGCLAGVV